MLLLEKAKGTAKSNNRIWYIFNCKICNDPIKIRKDHLNIHEGNCKQCRYKLFGDKAKKRPFEALYNKMSLYCKRKGIELLIKYEEFLRYTDISLCHYCDAPIDWTEYNTQYHGSKFNLDRKDPKSSYSLNNCVVCCSFCNYLKSDKFTYEEFLLLSPALRRIKESRSLL